MNTVKRFAAVLLPIAIGLAAPLPAGAAEPDVSRLPGFVDGSAFCDLAGEDSEIVEVHLGPSLLSALAKGVKEDKEAASILSGLRSISACVVNLEGDKDRTAKASKLVADAEARLEKAGWERLARVREKSERLNVFVLNDAGAIHGLTILILDRDQGETVFVNLAGTIDLARIGEIGDTLHVPGLDELNEGGKTGDDPGKGTKKQDEGTEP